MVRSVVAKKASSTPPKAAKPPTGKKAASKGQVERGTIDLFSDVERADVKYILLGLEKAPQLVPWLASLMRDGLLEKTLRVKMQGDQPAVLGRRLTGKKRWRNLAPRFWNLLWMNIFKEAPSVDDKDTKLSLAEHHALAEWALRVSMDGTVPNTHKGSAYEGPLLAVLKARHEQCGGLLAQTTAAKVKAGDFGFFMTDDPFDGNVQVRGHDDIVIEVVSAAKAAETNDWGLAENTNKSAALVSETLGFSQELFLLLKREMGDERYAKAFPEYDNTFELPNAADRFPDPKSYEQEPASSHGHESEPASSTDGQRGQLQVAGVIITPLKKRRQLSDENTNS